jgi:hypothetical protein
VSKVSRVERGERLARHADELLAIAYALGVSPTALLVPDGGQVRVGSDVLPARLVRQWFRGQVPARDIDAATFYSEAATEEASSEAARTALTLVRVLYDLLDAIDVNDTQRALQARSEVEPLARSVGEWARKGARS